MHLVYTLRPWLLAAAALLSYPSLAQTTDVVACEPVVARLIATEGTLTIRRAANVSVRAASVDDSFCTGDVLEVGPFSRAALQLPDQTVVRVDQDTVVSFATPRDDRRTWLDILRGAIQVISRDPRALRVVTPFANAGIEGTEFYVGVTADATTVIVFEGRVRVENQQGSAVAATGESVRARAGSAPVLEQLVRPRDAVVWTLYFPPTAAGPLPAADESAEGRDATFLVGRAERRLGLGRVTEAEADLAAAFVLEPGSPDVLARQSVIALTRNEPDRASALVDQAVASAPDNPAARLAQSYVRQAAGDLAGATRSLQAAAAANPDNALVFARLAELQLGAGEIAASERAARTALVLDTELGLARTVLGFVALTRVQLAEARREFDAAIRLEPSAPLPRLGLGLAQIRGGDLAGGRAEIETAVILDPGSALVRSYMGKAYFDEKRDGLAAGQYAIAKELDPNDPTPWFYEAIRQQTRNDPVGALGNLLAAIERNDNRAVFRSQLLLDQDLAARSASQGRIVRDLGFDELALRQGWAAVAAAPGDYSGHRLLADSYASLPRHERARVSELYQSQLLQPLNLTPVQPQLGEANLFILDSAGPSSIAFNEFNPLFNRDRIAVQASATVAGNSTWGNDAVLAGIAGRASFSLGQFHFETDGFRENNDLEQNTFNAIFQYAISPETSVFAEARSTRVEQGDLQLLFDPENYIASLRQEEDADALRLGIRHALNPRSTLIASAIYQTAELSVNIPPAFNIMTDVDGYRLELQHQYRGDGWNLVSGVRYLKNDLDEFRAFAFPIPEPPFLIESEESLTYDRSSFSAYGYAGIEILSNVELTLGLAADWLRGEVVDRDRLNPKAGLAWQVTEATTIRLAAFRTLQEPTISRQNQEPGLEPTQVRGFNQFFFGSEGEEVSRYGLALDSRLSPKLAWGAEGSLRDRDVPQIIAGFPDPVDIVEVDETLLRGYAYWTPTSYLAVRAEYQYEKADNNGVVFAEGFSELETHRLPFGLRFFTPAGLGGGLTATYVDQQGIFGELEPPFGVVSGEDSFWVLDADLQFRLPRRLGIVSLQVRNLLDKSFRFQDTDPENPRIFPERFVGGRLTLAF